jgi:hypothetical protein
MGSITNDGYGVDEKEITLKGDHAEGDRTGFAFPRRGDHERFEAADSDEESAAFLTMAARLLRECLDRSW